MSAFFKLASVLLFSAFLGIGSAWYALETDRGAFRYNNGPWVTRLKAGDPDADPYTVAFFMRFGMLPARALETLYFFAMRDSDKQRLKASCSYDISGSVLESTRWTLSVHDGKGRLIRNAAKRHGFNSQNIIRSSNKNFKVALSPVASPGNWLPGGQEGERMLVLRLYNPAHKYISNPSGIPLPDIKKTGCL